MEETKKITLPSGAELFIGETNFEDAKALYQVFLAEMTHLKIEANTSIDFNLFKDMLIIGLASPKFETALKKCMSKCTYNGLRIDEKTFQPKSARGDYFNVCYEVAHFNISDFTKDLFAKFSAHWEKAKDFLASRS